MTPEPSNEYQKLVEAVARAIAAEIGRQDYGEPFPLDGNLCLAYLDQGEVDFGKVARAALSALKLPHAWCRTCGKDWPKDENCDVCQQWWRENSPELKLPHAGDGITEQMVERGWSAFVMAIGDLEKDVLLDDMTPDEERAIVRAILVHALALPTLKLPHAGDDGWQDISTATKKELIDIWIKCSDGGVRWTDCYYDSICGEWRTTSPSGHLVSVKERFVTHWRPLPTSPAGVSDNG